jgi:hypothetical protein
MNDKKDYAPQRPSGYWGIFSFTIGIVIAILTSTFYFYDIVSNYGLDKPKFTLILFAGVFCSISGLVTGNYGLKSRKKTFSILGIIICSLVFIFWVWMVLMWSVINPLGLSSDYLNAVSA